MKVDTKSDFILLILRDNPIKGITRLEKLLFLLKMDGKFDKLLPAGKKYFEYKPFRMGPFSPEIYDMILFLKNAEIISIKNTDAKINADMLELKELNGEINLSGEEEVNELSDQINKIFALTEKGEKIARKLYNLLPIDKKRYLDEIKNHYSKISLVELLKEIYRRYEKYTTKSEIKRSLGL